jgi:hypothetical protein
MDHVPGEEIQAVAEPDNEVAVLDGAPVSASTDLCVLNRMRLRQNTGRGQEASSMTSGYTALGLNSDLDGLYCSKGAHPPFR